MSESGEADAGAAPSEEGGGGDEVFLDRDSFEAQLARREAANRAAMEQLDAEPEPGVVLADTPMWLSHHWPSEYDRCAVIAGRHVCRRCLLLYPLAIVSAIAIGAGNWWPESLDVWLLWLLPLPSVLEFCGEHAGLLRHSPRRQLALTALLAVACGRLYVRYLDDFRDPLVLAVVAVYGGACLLAGLARAFRPPADGP